MTDSLDWLRKQGYTIHAYWLNSGWQESQYQDSLHLTNWIAQCQDQNILTQVNASILGSHSQRAEDVRNSVYNWALSRNLIY